MFHDIIGAEDIVGAELALGATHRYDPLDSVFGAYRNPVFGYQTVVGAADQNAVETALASRNSAMVVPRQVTKAREYPLGFPLVTLDANETQTVSTQPQVPFRGRRLVISSDNAGSLVLLDLKVGKNSMFPSSNPVPARAFQETGVGVDLNLDTAQISQFVSITLQNISADPLPDISMCIIGTAVE